LWHDVYRELETERTKRTVEFSVEALPVIHADAALMRVVVTNLLGNALKYTRPRNPTLIAVGARLSPGEAPVFFIRDNGVGFALRDAEKLFGVFQRLHHSHEFEGTGIGLATVRRIVERHGGTIWAEAEPDFGATFFFTIPDR
jgi:light-regulated signal transduction histidine kinase (bacteriophytochrome)